MYNVMDVNSVTMVSKKTDFESLF